MVAQTPNTAAHDALATLASRYINVDSLPWVATKYAGIDMKTLVEDPESGLVTGLFRFQPGAQLPYHEHVEIEQSWILQGALHDHEGVAREGDFVWRPAGNRHAAWSEEGCIALSFFLKPNKFFLEDGEHTGWDQNPAAATIT